MLGPLVPPRGVCSGLGLPRPLPPGRWTEGPAAPEKALTEVSTLRGVVSADGGAVDAAPQELVVVPAVLLVAAQRLWATETGMLLGGGDLWGLWVGPQRASKVKHITI